MHVINTPFTLNIRSQIDGPGLIGEKKTIELNLFYEDIHFLGETNKISRHNGIMIPPRIGKMPSKESKRLKNWICVPRITPTKKKYFVSV